MGIDLIALGVPREERTRKKWNSRRDPGKRPQPQPRPGPDFDDLENEDLADCIAAIHREDPFPDPEGKDLSDLLERTLRGNSAESSRSRSSRDGTDVRIRRRDDTARTGKKEKKRDNKRKASSVPASVESEDEDRDGEKGEWTSEEEEGEEDAAIGIDSDIATATGIGDADWDCPYPEDLDEKRYACTETISSTQNFFFYLHLLEYRLYASERK